MTSKEMVEKAVHILDSKKAVDIQVLDIFKVSTLGDYFIIASGNNPTHVNSLVNEVEGAFNKEGIEPRSIEGKNSASWVLMDYLDIVIHVFDKETRNYYQLERLWGDATTVDISQWISEE